MIYDCFTFFNELDVLECRLSTLNLMVDQFVLIESDRSFAGNPKPLYYETNKTRFEGYSHKIRHYVVHDLPGHSSTPWDREDHSRECIKKAIPEVTSRDWVAISDCDEIPCPEWYYHVPYNIKQPVLLDLQYYYYRFNLRCSDRAKSAFPKIVPGDYFMNRSIKDIRYKNEGIKVIPNGGWHFSYMGDEKAFINKVSNFGHCNEDGARDLVRRVEAGEKPWEFDSGKLCLEPRLSNLPHWVQDNERSLRERNLLI